MLTKYVYPKCANTFRNWCLSNSAYEKIYYEIGEPQVFDVSLRDGLQGLTKDEQCNYTTSDKLKIYHNILFNYKPMKMEIGSIVSEKVFPVFKDSIHLYNSICFQKKNILSNEDLPNNYILVPNKNKLKTVINNPEINHFSFITSFSNSFQMKNIKMSLEESDKDIQSMLYELDNNKYRQLEPVIKLYVSCFNECPIEGKIDTDFIINRLIKFNTMKIDTVCLADTCGTLTVKDFEYIIDMSSYFGLFPTNKLSLHLHYKNDKEYDVEQLIHKALDYKITEFDVSALDSGGCSVTMDKNRLSSNLSYELYYKSLCNYIIEKSQSK